MKRFPFLDWMRGLAVVIMIECHVFNSYARMDTRQGGPYVLSQFVGGMAAPLFLFMAGMTFAFGMDSLDRREPRPLWRCIGALRRAGYILAIAFAFRLSAFITSIRHPNPQDLVKVDILNCMAVALAVLAGLAAVGWKERAKYAALAGIVVAAAAPVVANLPWQGVPELLRDYIAPVSGTGHFAFFPFAAYAAFGVAAGAVVKRAEADGFDRLMQWAVLIGFPVIFAAQYFSNIPFSIYPKSDFWANSPALVLIRSGVILLMGAAAYLWTQYLAGGGWSWMLCLGKNSLMVYWVHVMLVYGDVTKPLKRNLSIPQTVMAVVVVTIAMVGLSAAWLWWKRRRAAGGAIGQKNTVSVTMS